VDVRENYLDEARAPDAHGLLRTTHDEQAVAALRDAGEAAPRHQMLHHQAAVKALAWSPHQANLLATGGGTAPPTPTTFIRAFWGALSSNSKVMRGSSIRGFTGSGWSHSDPAASRVTASPLQRAPPTSAVRARTLRDVEYHAA
jgi:hypothetical protein